jgi:hypothetical protein
MSEMIKPFLYPYRRALAGILCLGFCQAASGATIDFAGRTWDLKAAAHEQGPGPSFFSDSSGSVWVDAQDQLHLRIRQIDREIDGVIESVWHSAQVLLPDALGYGTYQFKTSSNPEPFEDNVVWGLFVYQDDFNEIDVEFSRFNDPSKDVGQFVTQPGGKAGNKERFATGLTGSNPLSTHQFTWLPDSIEFQSYRGHSTDPSDLIREWVYTGDDIPLASGGATPRINLWQFKGVAPSQPVEVIINDFQFTPVPEPSSLMLSIAAGSLLLTRKRRWRRCA